MIDLTNKVALVVGGSGIIGSVITRSLVQAGAFCYITYQSSIDKAHFLAADLVGPSGQIWALPFYCNVTSRASCRNLAKALEQDRGQLDILVHCAGINRPAPFDQISGEDWDKVIEINLTGAFNVIQALFPLIRDGGSIIFIGSSSAVTGGPVSSHYAASKAGLVALMQNVALFGASRSVRSNLVSPGYIQSPMANQAEINQAVRDKIDMIPLSRLGQPEDVTGPVLFLASDLAGYMTGQVLRVDGGLTW